MSNHDFPCMRTDSDDYLEPDSYGIDWQLKSGTVHVCHSLSASNSLPGQWLQKELAHFVCEVRAPHLLYGRRNEHLQPPRLIARGLTAEQTMQLPDAGNNDLYLAPAVVLRRNCRVNLDWNLHGVARFWHGRTILVPRGAVLASGDPLPFTSDNVHPRPNTCIDRARSALNPLQVTADPLTTLRDRMVNAQFGHRGGPEQIAFLQAVVANRLLEYLAARGVGTDFSTLDTPLLPTTLREADFDNPSVAVAQMIRETFRRLTLQEAATVAVWNAITLHHIQAERLTSSCLAKKGRERIGRALDSHNSKHIDDCVRTVFRSMGGLSRIRGKVSVLSDCFFSRCWWIGQIVERSLVELEFEEQRAWEQLARHWSIVSELAIKRMPMLTNPVLMAGLTAFLARNPALSQAQFRIVIRQIGNQFSAISPYAWSAEDVYRWVQDAQGPREGA